MGTLRPGATLEPPAQPARPQSRRLGTRQRPHCERPALPPPGPGGDPLDAPEVQLELAQAVPGMAGIGVGRDAQR